MKKLFSVALAVLMIVSIVGLVNAEIIQTRDPSSRISSEVISSAANGAAVSSFDSTANRLLGFTATGSSAAAAGLYDTTSTTNVRAGTGVFAEAYFAAGDAETVMFPLPKVITNTLYACTPNTGVVVIYYE